ncbi:MAG: hypothetical protein U0X91_23495 [Spirosomataceae bacterium]
MKHLLFGLICFFIFQSCQNPADTAASNGYFDLKGFISNQITELNKRKPLVVKEMAMGNNNDKKQTSDIDWAKELELFIQADLNKQAYQLSYDVIHPTPTTSLYLLKSGEKLPVKSLKIIVDEASKLPGSVEALIKTENKLYDSEKLISLTCTRRPEGVWLVKTYEIRGFQQLALSEKKAFSIKGNLQ